MLKTAHEMYYTIIPQLDRIDIQRVDGTGILNLPSLVSPHLLVLQDSQADWPGHIVASSFGQRFPRRFRLIIDLENEIYIIIKSYWKIWRLSSSIAATCISSTRGLTPPRSPISISRTWMRSAIIFSPSIRGTHSSLTCGQRRFLLFDWTYYFSFDRDKHSGGLSARRIIHNLGGTIAL